MKRIVENAISAKKAVMIEQITIWHGVPLPVTKNVPWRQYRKREL